MEKLRFKINGKTYRLTENAICTIEGALMVPVAWGALVVIICLFG